MAQCMAYNGYSTLLVYVGYGISYVVPKENVHLPSCTLMPKKDENLQAALDSTHQRRVIKDMELR